MGRSILPDEYPSDNPIPAALQGYVSVRGAATVFAGGGLAADAKAYHAKKPSRHDVEKNLGKAGFRIVAETPLGFAVAAPAAAYEELTGGTVVAVERRARLDAAGSTYVTQYDIVGKGQPEAFGVGAAASKAAKIDGVVISRPRQLHGPLPMAGPSPFPPASAKFHLRVPGDVAASLNAAAVHAAGIRGAGVLVAMVDTGFFRHPYFLSQGCSFKPNLAVVPGTNPSKDPSGHGTGESANVFAAAPGVVFQGVRASNDAGQLVGAQAGFLMAKSLAAKPRVITNSWGGNYNEPFPDEPDAADLAFAAEIQDAVADGICVVFSAGNGHFGPEPQVPGVISAGGTFVGPTGALQASDYASGYNSPWFGGVHVPTVCGLVGMLPRAQYIMLPVQPDCDLDNREAANEPAEPGDGTTATDGWALFSGTSAAAPQLAGVIALLLEAKPALTPAQVKEALAKTARDVASGTGSPRFLNQPAGPGFDVPTGPGLVDALAAVKFVQDNF